MKTMKLYVGTYAKYNEGSIFGEWVDLDDFTDKEEFYSYCHELHKDEEDPEFMFQDFESVEDWEDSFYNESFISPNYWTVKDLINSRGINEEAFSAFLSLNGYEGNEIDEGKISEFEECYYGKYDSLADYCEELANECGDLENVPDYIRNNIDWVAIARDEEYNGYIKEFDGFVFRAA